MFSSLLEFVQKLQEMKLKKQKKETKKIVEDEKKKLKEEEKSVVEVESEVKKSKEVKVETEKEHKLKIKIWVLRVLKWILQIIEWFISFLVSIFGVLGFFIILIVLVLMIVIYGLMHLDFDIPESHIYSGSDYENCIQGGSVFSTTGYDINAMSQLQGTMTEYQKQLFETLSLYTEILSLPRESVFIQYEQLNEMDSKIGVDNLAKFFMGFSATETGLRFDNGDRSVLEYPSKQAVNDKGYAFLGLHKNNTFDGKYRYKDGVAGNQVLQDSFVSSWKSKYTPKETPILELNYVPYGVATQVGSIAKSYLVSHFNKVAQEMPAIMDAYGIQANREQLIAFAQLFASSSAYHAGDKGQFTSDLLSLWCGLWSATSTIDNERSFDKVEIIWSRESDYTESTARKYTLGVSGTSNIAYKPDQSKTGYFKVNGKDIDKVLWAWVAENCSNPDYFNSTAVKWLNKYENSTLILDGHYGLIAYLMGNRVIASLGGSVPVVTGGTSASDCDCYENGSLASGIIGDVNFNNIQTGKPQGPWSADTKEKMLNSYSSNITQYLGTAESINNSSRKLSGLDKTVEEWRQSTRWGVPYYFQSNSVPESGKNSLNSYISALKTMGNAACHVYMNAYITSALTSTVINPVEMLLGMRITGGIAGDGTLSSSTLSKAYDDLGLKAIYVRADGGNMYVSSGDIDAFCSTFGVDKSDVLSKESAAIQKVVDAVLSKNGLVGFAGGKDYFTAHTNHYVVIHEKTNEGYRIVGYNDSGVYPGSDYKKSSVAKTTTGDIYNWEYIYAGMVGHVNGRGYDHQRMFAWNPNLNVGSVNTSVSSTKNLGKFLFIGDSFTQGWRSILEKDGHEVIAAVGASPGQYVGMSKEAREIGTGDSKTIEGPLPDIVGLNGVAVLLGVNNLAQTDSMQSFLTELLEKYTVPIYVQKVFPVGVEYKYGDSVTTNQKIIAFNDNIRAFCDTNPRLFFIDATAGYIDENGYLLKCKDDGLHLLASESENAYNNIKQALLGLGGSAIVGSGSVNCINSPTLNTGSSFIETPGNFQGPWGDLTQYLDNLSEDRKNTMLELKQYVGLKPINVDAVEYKYTQDKWISYNGLGVVRYLQGGNGGKLNNETWGHFQYSTRDFMYAACGAYSTAAVASTILGKYINPPELILAAVTYKYRHPEIKEPTDMENLREKSTSIFGRNAQKYILEELGFKVELATMTQDKLDACMNNGGMVIMCVTKDNGKGSWFTSSDSGHYIVVREKTSDGNYLIFSSTHWECTSDSIRAKATNYKFTYSEIIGMVSGLVNYVTP